MSQDTIELRCELAGLRMTEQRRLIARVLQEATDHPDVEQVYSRAIKFDPAISIATVYRTVKLFEESGILEKLFFLWPGPGWGPVRVGALSGLGPCPGWGPYGPIWTLMFFFFLKKVTFRVQTAPFDKVTTEFWRSRRRLYIPDLLKAKKMRRQIIIF